MKEHLRHVIPYFIAAGLTLASVGNAACAPRPDTSTEADQLRATITALQGDKQAAAPPAPRSQWIEPQVQPTNPPQPARVEARLEPGWQSYFSRDPKATYEFAIETSWQPTSSSLSFRQITQIKGDVVEAFAIPDLTRLHEQQPAAFYLYKEPVNSKLPIEQYMGDMEKDVDEINDLLQQRYRFRMAPTHKELIPTPVAGRQAWGIAHESVVEKIDPVRFVYVPVRARFVAVVLIDPPSSTAWHLSLLHHPDDANGAWQKLNTFKNLFKLR